MTDSVGPGSSSGLQGQHGSLPLQSNLITSGSCLRSCYERLHEFLSAVPALPPSQEIEASAQDLLNKLTKQQEARASLVVNEEASRDFSHLLVTNPGLEKVSAEEAASVFGDAHVVPSPFGVPGYVGVGGLSDVALDKLVELRSVHDVLCFHTHFRIGQEDRRMDTEGKRDLLGEICEKVKAVELAAVFKAEGSEVSKTFRVSCERSGGMKAGGEAEGGGRKRGRESSEADGGAAASGDGKHGFRSSELEREVGSVLHEKYQAAADMKGFEVCVRVDVVQDHVLVGSMPNRQMLSKRHKLAFVRSVTLKPNVAYCMIRMAALQPGHALLDPFCGGGTVPLEAAQVFRPSPGRLCGGDRSQAVVKGAQANAVAAGVAELTEFKVLNARGLDREYENGAFDAVVTNPPWGVRVGKDADLERIYRGFLFAAAKVVRVGGRVVFLVQRCEMVLDIVRRIGLYTILGTCAVKTGELVATIFVLENRGCDYLRDALKQQVRTLAPLISSGKPGGDGEAASEIAGGAVDEEPGTPGIEGAGGGQ